MQDIMKILQKITESNKETVNLYTTSIIFKKIFIRQGAMIKSIKHNLPFFESTNGKTKKFYSIKLKYLQL